MKRHALMLFTAITFMANTAIAQAPNSGTTAWYLTFENDLFFNSDRYYTDGIQFTYRDREGPPPVWLQPWLRSACDLLRCKEREFEESRSKLGQLMYTPVTLDVAAPQPHDRPWAGLLYFTKEYEFVDAQETARTIFTGQLGIIGPHSMVEGTQKWVHKTFSGTHPEGWDNQIGTELGLMAMAERRNAVPLLSTRLGSNVDLRTTRSWRLAVGNIMTFAAAGATIEIGKGISPTSQSPAPIGTKSRREPYRSLNTAPDAQADEAKPSTDCLFDWLRCTATAAVELRWMIRNAFLDGTLFRDSPRVDSRPLVADLMLGVKLEFPRTRTPRHGPLFVQFTTTQRTPEFRSPAYRVPTQRFGALTIGTEF